MYNGREQRVEQKCTSSGSFEPQKSRPAGKRILVGPEKSTIHSSLWVKYHGEVPVTIDVKWLYHLKENIHGSAVNQRTKPSHVVWSNNHRSIRENFLECGPNVCEAGRWSERSWTTLANFPRCSRPEDLKHCDKIWQTGKTHCPKSSIPQSTDKVYPSL